MPAGSLSVKLTNEQVADAISQYLAQQGMACSSVSFAYNLEGFWANSGVTVNGVTARVTLQPQTGGSK